ncbi:hypothetical protein SAMN06265348_10147 [Pedobacter westerhofensis]|uniref:Uncharacterized protein n=1 Tax=Pedobacter westerhofensis TaxID=425512 RepID=A0A521ACF5_9SPHI|nr:hypothetical protein SAMN06265348_10147 [Pedobacter westerhofensis]
MMRKILLTTSILLSLIASVQSQQLKKPTLYLYFDSSNTSLYYKDHEKTTIKVKGKRVPYMYETYHFKILSENVKWVAFVNDHLENYKIVDSLFLKKYAVAINDIKNASKIRFDTYDKRRFPYNKLYIIELGSMNKYKLFEVRTMLDSNY